MADPEASLFCFMKEASITVHEIGNCGLRKVCKHSSASWRQEQTACCCCPNWLSQTCLMAQINDSQVGPCPPWLPVGGASERQRHACPSAEAHLQNLPGCQQASSRVLQTMSDMQCWKQLTLWHYQKPSRSIEELVNIILENIILLAHA